MVGYNYAEWHWQCAYRRFFGRQCTTVTACIPYRLQKGTVDATKVDGATVTWQTAVDAMNTAPDRRRQSGVTKGHCRRSARIKPSGGNNNARNKRHA